MIEAKWEFISIISVSRLLVYRVIHLNVPNFILNNFKSSKDKTKLLCGKEAEFYENFSNIIDLKIRPSVTKQRID